MKKDTLIKLIAATLFILTTIGIAVLVTCVKEKKESVDMVEPLP